jgi:hypothetical protein
MELQQLAQVGEFLGGLSVLLTLIYLAIQIRGNTKAVRSAGAQQTHDTLIQAYRQLAGDAELNRIFRNGTRDINSLSEDETGQFYAVWSGVLYIAQNWLYQRDSGVLDEKLVMTFLTGMSNNFHADGFKAYWSERKHTFSDALQEWAEDAMSAPPARVGMTTLGPALKHQTPQE